MVCCFIFTVYFFLVAVTILLVGVVGFEATLRTKCPCSKLNYTPIFVKLISRIACSKNLSATPPVLLIFISS
jgi:hypothetical protein